MANTVIDIDEKKVKDAGASIKTDGDKMYKALQNIKTIVDGTKKCLDSDGGDEARKHFNASAAKFDEFKKFIHEYGDFLQNYSGAHKKLDTGVAELAKKIPKL